VEVVTVRGEIIDLRERLRRLAAEVDVDLARYALRPLPSEVPSAYRRLRRAFGRQLRRWGLRPTPPLEPWFAGLNHYPHREDAKPLVIWALGCERDVLRAACRGFAEALHGAPGFAPVLVTDVADFAFFSRLGWLVELVPPLSAPAAAYAARKERYLAWRYRDAPALPVSAGLEPGLQIEDALND
jgi:hypothetical protein